MGTFAEALARSQAGVPTGPCPPLPTITQNLAYASDWEAARAHFTCVIKKETGGVWTTAQQQDREKRTNNFIYSSLAKYANVTGAGAQVVETKLKEIEAYSPPVLNVAPKIITPTAPAPATVAPEPKVSTGATLAPQPKGTNMDLSTLGIIGGTAVGGPIGGVIGTGLSVLGGLGGSKCPGPYNYDPLTGGCVPKADYWARVGGGGETPTSPGTKPTGFVGGSGACPTGYRWDGQRCIETGMGGAIERFLPGGQTGTGMDVYGQAVVGAWGKPALVPYTGSIPTRRCPPGAVLGKDNLCYARNSIPNSERKWPKPPRPLLTAQEMKTLRKIKSLEKKVKRAWQAAGSPGKPHVHRKTTRKR